MCITVYHAWQPFRIRACMSYFGWVEGLCCVFQVYLVIPWSCLQHILSNYNAWATLDHSCKKIPLFLGMANLVQTTAGFLCLWVEPYKSNVFTKNMQGAHPHVLPGRSSFCNHLQAFSCKLMPATLFVENIRERKVVCWRVR